MTESARGPRDHIEHVIVLMLENRSFDHLLGYLDHPDPSYGNLAAEPGVNPVDPTDPGGPSVSTTPDADPALGVDPGHSPDDVRLQVFGDRHPPADAPVTMSGFVASYANQLAGDQNPLRRAWRWIKAWWRSLFGRPAVPVADTDIMRCFTEETAPVLCGLAKHYAVLANWFSSVPGETWPNRNFAHAATSSGTNTIVPAFYAEPTIFDRLGSDGWRVYHEGIPQVWVFPSLWSSANNRDNFRDTGDLFADIATKDLPSYTFIEPDHGFGPGAGNSQHPSNNTSDGDSFRAGEALIARIYHALAADPDFFATTLFLVTYDEHGGFFDRAHPVPVVPPDDRTAADGFDFTLSGVRVPAVAISPLIPKGTIARHQFDHATIPATVRAQFLPGQPALTRRDEAANDLLACLDLLDQPRTDRLAFDVCAPTGTAATEHLNELQASLVSLAGAVRTRLRAGTVESLDHTPPYEPTSATATAAETRRLDSSTRQEIADVLARFGRGSLRGDGG